MKTIIDFVNTASMNVNYLSADEEKELVAKAQKGDKKASDSLFRANVRFILKEAKNYARSYGMSLEDCFSSACEGFMKAIERYDAEKGTRLITIAIWWIKSCIQEESYNSHLIKIPYKKIARLQDKEFWNSSRPEDVELMKIAGEMDSLDSPLWGEDDGDTMADSIKSIFLNPMEEYEKAEVRNLIDEVITNNLTDREEFVLRKIFGFDDGEKYSLSDVGKMLGCTKQRADQIKNSALAKLRKSEAEIILSDFVA